MVPSYINTTHKVYVYDFGKTDLSFKLLFSI